MILYALVLTVPSNDLKMKVLSTDSPNTEIIPCDVVLLVLDRFSFVFPLVVSPSAGRMELPSSWIWHFSIVLDARVSFGLHLHFPKAFLQYFSKGCRVPEVLWPWRSEEVFLLSLPGMQMLAGKDILD